MAVIHFHHQRQNPRRQKQRSSRREVMQRFRDSQGSSEVVNGMTLIGIGVILLAGWIAAELSHAPFFGSVLLFFSCPFLVFGGLLLLLIAVEALFRHFQSIQSHCGRCRFYRPLDGGYSLGRCLADPRQRVTQRTNHCQFYEYSERAMVRDRFAQRAAIEARHRGNNSIGSSV